MDRTFIAGPEFADAVHHVHDQGWFRGGAWSIEAVADASDYGLLGWRALFGLGPKGNVYKTLWRFRSIE